MENHTLDVAVCNKALMAPSLLPIVAAIILKTHFSIKLPFPKEKVASGLH